MNHDHQPGSTAPPFDDDEDDGTHDVSLQAFLQSYDGTNDNDNDNGIVSAQLENEPASTTARIGSSAHRSSSSRRRQSKKAKRRNPGLVRKLQHVTHLLRSLDTLVFAELAALYYMECSFFRYFIRVAIQTLYLTPKPDNFPLHIPVNRGHAILVALPNVICMLLHFFCKVPVGIEHHRGYQHGGIMMDFVGQKPPTSRLYYLVVNVVIFVVQCLMLTIHAEREALRVTLKITSLYVTDPTTLFDDNNTSRSIEDLDAEERGITRLAPSPSADTPGESRIGVQEFPRETEAPSSTVEGSSSSARRSARKRRRMVEGKSKSSARIHLSDLMASGNAVLGEYHVMHSVRSAALDWEGTAAQSLQSLGYASTMAALQIRGRNVAAQAAWTPPGL